MNQEKETGATLAAILKAYRNGERGLPGYAELEQLAGPAAAEVTVSPAPREPKPSFFVITDNKGNAEYVTNLRHEAQEHINDACGEGVEGAGTWRAVPVFEMRPTDDHLWEQTLRDRDAYHEWADKLAEAISTYFDAYIGEHSNTNLPWAEALEAIEGAHLARQAQPTDRDAPTQSFDAAAFIEKRAADYLRDNASTEHETGATIWHYGEAGHSYHSGLVELAEEIRALKGKSGSEGAAS